MAVEVNAKFSPRAKEDFKLVERAIGGDQAAYSVLLDRYRDSIYFMVLKMVHNRDDAEDLTIEAFGKAFNNLEKYSPQYAFSTWLFKIATNNCIDFIRKKRLEATSLDEPIETSKGDELQMVLEDSGLDPEEKFMKNQRAELLREIIQTLNPKYRTLIELRFFKEFSY
jgi:RNA polymerase sigma-70 factor (ECF subfamily)